MKLFQKPKKKDHTADDNNAGVVWGEAMDSVPNQTIQKVEGDFVFRHEKAKKKTFYQKGFATTGDGISMESCSTKFNHSNDEK